MNIKYLKLLLASASAVFLLAEASAKPIASVEYFYAADGTLTGRAVNGKLQQYQYDKKGQLVAVVEALSRRIVEHYVYDPAGNILSKTVNEKTTTYIYDKANQLISSTCEGKVTKYQYDAAGRMVKEGEKSYYYGYLDKILEIQENGRQVAAFDYHMDGQIASAMYGDKSEDFLWDGLALIHRGATNFINEPYVTGGNPILSSKDGVMFNDMLGNSLNIGGKDIAITAFGETESVEAMFTGKPYIDGLGYAFLYRNYRADQGKWQTTDPLGYPDGWNNFAYCENKIIKLVDSFGLVTVYIGGGSEFSSTKTVTDFMKNSCPVCGKTISENTASRLFAWTDKDDVISFINSFSPDEEITIVGHSYGGDTAYLVARDCGRTINTLITLDPVSNFTYNITMPDGVCDWYNIYVTGENYGLGDFIADIGGQWKDVNGATNIAASGLQHGDVMGMMVYASSNGYPVFGRTHVCE